MVQGFRVWVRLWCKDWDFRVYRGFGMWSLGIRGLECGV